MSKCLHSCPECCSAPNPAAVLAATLPLHYNKKTEDTPLAMAQSHLEAALITYKRIQALPPSLGRKWRLGMMRYWKGKADIARKVVTDLSQEE